MDSPLPLITALEAQGVYRYEEPMPIEEYFQRLNTNTEYDTTSDTSTDETASDDYYDSAYESDTEFMSQRVNRKLFTSLPPELRVKVMQDVVKEDGPVTSGTARLSAILDLVAGFPDLAHESLHELGTDTHTYLVESIRDWYTFVCHPMFDQHRSAITRLILALPPDDCNLLLNFTGTITPSYRDDDDDHWRCLESLQQVAFVLPSSQQITAASQDPDETSWPGASRTEVWASLIKSIEFYSRTSPLIHLKSIENVRVLASAEWEHVVEDFSVQRRQRPEFDGRGNDWEWDTFWY